MSNDTKTTVLGLVMAGGTAAVDFFAHNPMEGGAMKQPTFWLGLLIAVAMGLKGFYTNKADAPKPAA